MKNQIKKFSKKRKNQKGGIFHLIPRYYRRKYLHNRR